MKLSEISSKIKNRTSIYVNGEVDFSHITYKIEGEELERANKFTKFPQKDGYYQLVLRITTPDSADAFELDRKNESECALAAYELDKVYVSKKDGKKGMKLLNLISRSNEIRVYKVNDNGELDPVKLPHRGELAPGTKVKVEIVFFETAYGSGVGFNSVIIDGDIKLYQGSYNPKGYSVSNNVIEVKGGAKAPTKTEVVTREVEAEVVEGDDDMPESVGEEVDDAPVAANGAPKNTTFDTLINKFKG